MIRAGALQSYIYLMESLGVNPYKLLEKYNIDIQLLSVPENYISLVNKIQLLEESARVAKCPDFGIRLASYQKSDLFGVFALIMFDLSNFQHVIKNAVKYTFIHCPEYRVLVDAQSHLRQDCFAFRFEIDLPEFIIQRQTIEGCIAKIFLILKEIGVQQSQIRAISFPHTPLASKAIYLKFFGAPIYTAEPYACIHIKKEVWNLTYEEQYYDMRARAIELITHNFRSNNELLMRDKVREMIIKFLGIRTISKTEIAEILGVHPRTLQRRLYEEGTNFEDIKISVYKQAAARYINSTDLPLHQISDILGFSEQSAFTRAFKKWFQTSPYRFKEQNNQIPIDK